jgi:hypothetical protein
MRRPRALGLALALAATAAPVAARADAYSFELERPRTSRQRWLLAGLGGGAVLFGGIGLLLHLRTNRLADEVSATNGPTGLVYTEDREDTRAAAMRSRTLTIGAYGLAGGLLVATFVAFLITDPGTETITLQSAAPPIGIEPIDGGAVAWTGWRF